MEQLTFTFEGKNYTVGHEAYNMDGVIQLPDGRFVQVDYWLESLPVKIASVSEITFPKATQIV